MAVKRTSNLSSTVSGLDRRIKTVENGTVSISSSSAAVTTNVSADDENPTSGGNFTGNNAPYQYKRVRKAFIYGPKVTGNTSRAELYFSEDPEIVDAEYVQVQGIHGTSTDEIEVSGTFKVYDVDTPPWDDGARAIQPWRDEPATGITHTVWYNPVVVPPSSYPTNQGRELITTRLIDSVTASNTTVTINFNSTHRFKQGDVISVDLEDELFGIDGLFKVASVVDNNTITYTLDSPLGSPISLSGGTLGTKYVYPVAHRYVEDGTLWTDTSVEPNKVYIWNDYRWYDTTDAAVAESGGVDTVAPSPVTNLSATSAVQDIPTAEIAGKATITLTWDAPTTNEDSTAITDLGGYSVWWRYSLTDEWRINEIDDPTITTWFGENFTYNVTVLLAVYAKDKFGNRSTAATTSILTSATPAVSIGIPSAPSVTGYLGTMKVYWNGLNADNNAITPNSGVFEVILHVSKTNNFTPSSGTLYERFPAINGPTYTVIPGNAILDGGPVIDGQPYYFKFVFLDVWGNQTGASAQGSFVGKVSDIVTYDMLDVGTLVGQTIVGLDIRTSSNPSANGGLVLDQTGFTAYNSAGVQTFNISAATGAILIGSSAPATQADIGNFIEGSEVNNFVTSITNTTITTPTLTGGTVQTTSLANRGIKLTGSNLTAYNSSGTATFTVNGSTGAVTINGGSLTISSGADLQGYATDTELGTVQGDITGVKNNIYVAGTTEINGAVIRTGTLLADRIGSGTLPVGVIYAGSISATQVTAGTFTGSTFRTAAGTAKRVIVSGSSNTVKFYNTGDDDLNERGTIEGTSTGMLISGRSSASLLMGSNVVDATSGTSRMLLSTSAGLYNGSGSLSTGSGTTEVIGPGGSSVSMVLLNSQMLLNAVQAGSTPAFLFAGSSDNVRIENLSGSTASTISAFATGTLYRGTGSDQRLKENVAELQGALDIIKNSRPVTFSYKEGTGFGDGIHYGLIAQELQALLPEENTVIGTTKIEAEDDDIEYLTIEYQRLIPIALAAIKELSSKVVALEDRIATLEGTT